MRSEIMDTITIYEINGLQYTGPRKIDIKSHPRFLSFVTLCIDNQEYSIACDDLMRALERSTRQVPTPDDDMLVEGRPA